MSRQRFPDSHRTALWRAHNRRCLYCEEPIPWRHLEIDHVVPERLEDDPTAREAALRECGLPMDWEIRGERNLAPACERCNLTKHGSLLPAGQTILLLNKVAAKLALVVDHQARLVREAKSDALRVKVALALAQGTLSASELEDLVHTRGVDVDVSWTHALGVFRGEHGDELDRLRPVDAERLAHAPLDFGPAIANGLELWHEALEPMTLRTCFDYRSAMAKGYYAPSNWAVKWLAMFQQINGLLEAVEASMPSEKTYLRDPRVGLCDLDLLPSRVIHDALSVIGLGGQETFTTNQTVADLLTSGAAKVTSVGSFHLDLEMDGLIVHVRELLRADLDGDGYEDILAWCYVRATMGTLGVGTEPCVLARRDRTSRFETSRLALPQSDK